MNTSPHAFIFHFHNSRIPNRIWTFTSYSIHVSHGHSCWEQMLQNFKDICEHIHALSSVEVGSFMHIKHPTKSIAVLLWNLFFSCNRETDGYFSGRCLWYVCSLGFRGREALQRRLTLSETERRNEYQRRYRERLKQNPELWRWYIKRQVEYNRRHLNKKKEDSVGRSRYLQ